MFAGFLVSPKVDAADAKIVPSADVAWREGSFCTMSKKRGENEDDKKPRPSWWSGLLSLTGTNLKRASVDIDRIGTAATVGQSRAQLVP